MFWSSNDTSGRPSNLKTNYLLNRCKTFIIKLSFTKHAYEYLKAVT